MTNIDSYNSFLDEDLIETCIDHYLIKIEKISGVAYRATYDVVTQKRMYSPLGGKNDYNILSSVHNNLEIEYYRPVFSELVFEDEWIIAFKLALELGRSKATSFEGIGLPLDKSLKTGVS